MDSFQLADDAILEIDGIWLYLREKEGVETADRVVTELFKGFYKLADIPKVLFYKVFSYLVIYEPGSNPLQILGVLHGKRNVARILKQRL